MALIDDFKAKFPEFDTTVVDNNIPALESVYPCMYGAKYGVTDCEDEAILYLLAHLLSLQTSGKTAIFASSKSDGDVSISYTLPNNVTEQYLFFASTSYGLLFWQVTFQDSQGAFFV